jgi:ATP-dependent protease ClpP protease subunit
MADKVNIKGKEVYVSFTAEVNPSTAEGLIAAVAQCVNQGATGISLLLSTPGGDVLRGVTFYHFLRALPIPLTIHNVGSVNSIGNAIFLAARLGTRFPIRRSCSTEWGSISQRA